MIVCLFGHTAQGEGALKELLEAGVPHADIRVIGDVGPAVSTPGAERHVTFDAMHLPAAERELFMDTIRAGGVVLGVEWESTAFVEKVAWGHKALKTIQVSAADANPSHNTAR